jgi:hypothetical protein
MQLLTNDESLWGGIREARITALQGDPKNSSIPTIFYSPLNCLGLYMGRGLIDGPEFKCYLGGRGRQRKREKEEGACCCCYKDTCAIVGLPIYAGTVSFKKNQCCGSEQFLVHIQIQILKKKSSCTAIVYKICTGTHFLQQFPLKYCMLSYVPKPDIEDADPGSGT